MKGDLPLLRTHGPNAEVIGRFAGYVATFEPGRMTRAALAELVPVGRSELGWIVLESEWRDGAEYVLRAELKCPANKHAREGSQPARRPPGGPQPTPPRIGHRG